VFLFHSINPSGYDSRRNSTKFAETAAAVFLSQVKLWAQALRFLVLIKDLFVLKIFHEGTSGIENTSQTLRLQGCPPCFSMLLLNRLLPLLAGCACTPVQYSCANAICGSWGG